MTSLSVIHADAVSFIGASGGTGTISVGSARPSFRTPAQAVAQNDLSVGQAVTYVMQDAATAVTQRAWGIGKLGFSGGIYNVTRDPNEKWINNTSSGSTPFNFTVNPIVSLTETAASLDSMAAKTAGTVSVNSFYPKGIPTGSMDPSTQAPVSRPLSNFFANLTVAAAAFPDLNFATYSVTLADEVDWCAWQACMDSIFNQPNLITGVKLPSATVIADGVYILNRTVLVQSEHFKLRGACPPHGIGPGEHGATWMIYNGSAGTVDVNKAILTIDPLNMAGTNVGVLIDGIGFKVCVGGALPAGTITSIGQASFVNAISLGNPANNAGCIIDLSRISKCTFSAGVWDGIKAICQILQFHVLNNQFYGVQRDAVAFCTNSVAFDTVIWMEKNEHGLVGRYNFFYGTGGISNHLYIEDDDWESAYSTSYFINNPEWFVQGVVASACIIGGNPFWINRLRTEGNADFTAGMWADLHLLGGTGTIQNSEFRNLVLSAQAASPQTAAYATYLAAHGFVDITNTRNWNANAATDIGGGAYRISDMHQDSMPGRIYILGGTSGSGGLNAQQSFKDCTVGWWGIPTQAGVNVTTVAQPQTTAVPILLAGPGAIASAIYQNCNVTTTTGTRFYYLGTGRPSGTVLSGAFNAVWQATHAYSAHQSNAYDPLVRPATQNGFIYQAIVGGTTGGSEPAWPVIIGNTVVDGTVTWKCVGTTPVTTEFFSGNPRIEEFNTFGGRTAIINPSLDAFPPVAGAHSPGEIVRTSGGVDGQPLEYVCTFPGTPGTWLPANFVNAARAATWAQLTSTTGFTVSAQDLSGIAAGPTSSKHTILLTGTLGAGANLTLPTVASMSALLGNITRAYTLRIINASSANFTWTVVPTGWSSAGGAFTIAQNTWRDFLVEWIDATPTWAIISLGTGTYS